MIYIKTVLMQIFLVTLYLGTRMYGAEPPKQETAECCEQYDPKRVEAQRLKQSLDTIMCACLGSKNWDQSMKFGEAIDRCLVLLEGKEHLFNDCADVFYRTKASCVMYPLDAVLERLLSIRDATSVWTIQSKLSDLRPLLPDEIQNMSNWRLGLNLSARLSRGVLQEPCSYTIQNGALVRTINRASN